MQPSFATMFSGGCIADVGIQAAGYQHLWGIEYDDAIASVARLNGFDVITANVLDVDPHKLETPYYLHASPVCTRASQANQTAEENEDGTKEAQLDLDMAAKVCEFLDVMKPQAFTLENVYGYRKFKAFQMITDTLSRLGYMWDYQNINSADFGVPQIRRRLILRARLGALLRPLPEPVEWVGWYVAIEDLIPTLPDSEFAPWQLERIPEEYKAKLLHSSALLNRNQSEREDYFRLANESAYTVCAEGSGGRQRAFIMPKENTSSAVIRDADEPAPTVAGVGRVGNRPRAFIVDGQGNSNFTSVTTRDESEPASTVTDSAEKASRRAYLQSGRVVKMTARALARFQSIPDSYILPEKESLATRIIGNGYPSLMAQRIAEGLLP